MNHALPTQVLMVGIAVLYAMLSPASAPAQVTASGGIASEQVYLFNLYFTLDSNPSLAASLELSEDQKEELRRVIREYRDRQSAMMKQYREDRNLGDREIAQQLYTDANNKLRTEVTGKLEAIFLDHQVKRLKQISLQQRSRYRGWSGGPRYSVARDGLNLPLQLAGELELDPQEIKALTGSIETIREEMEAEINRVKKEAFERMLRELSVEQRRKLQDLIGDPYDFESSRREQQEEMQRRAREKAERARQEAATNDDKDDQ